MKKGLSFVLGMLLCIMTLTLTPSAHVLAEQELIEIGSIDEIVLDETQSYRFKLTADSPVTKQFVIPKGFTVELDLNGHTLDSKIDRPIVNYGSLTVLNSAGEGKITASKSVFQNKGSLTIEAGIFETTEIGGAVVLSQAGTFTANGGAFLARSYALYLQATESILNGGYYKSVSTSADSFFGYCIKLFSGSLTIHQAEVYGIQGAVAAIGGDLLIEDGHFETEFGNARSFYALYVAGEDDIVKGTVNGGTFIGGKSYAIFCGNNGDGGNKKDASLTINNGIFMAPSSGSGVANLDAPSGKDLAIEGGRYYLYEGANQTFKSWDQKIVRYLTEGRYLNKNNGQVYYLKQWTDQVLLIEEEVLDLNKLAVASENKIEIKFISDSDHIRIEDHQVTAIKPGLAEIVAELGYQAGSNEPAKKTIKVIISEKSISEEDHSYIEKEEAEKIKEILDQIYSGNNEVVCDNPEALEKTLEEVQNGTAIMSLTVGAEAAQPEEIIEHQELIDAKLKSMLQEYSKAEMSAVLNLTLNLIKTNIINDQKEAIASLTALIQPIQFSLKLEDLIGASSIKTEGTYQIVRIHNGLAEIIPSVYDKGTKKITFETDRFSLFVVVYTEKQAEEPDQEEEPSEEYVVVNTADKV